MNVLRSRRWGNPTENRPSAEGKDLGKFRFECSIRNGPKESMEFQYMNDGLLTIYQSITRRYQQILPIDVFKMLKPIEFLMK